MAAHRVQIGDIGQSRVATARPGTWSATQKRCTVERALLAKCRVGHGVAYFVADADLLNAALWGTEGTANESAILRLVDRVATDKLF
jgi:hypothetical protein